MRFAMRMPATKRQRQAAHPHQRFRKGRTIPQKRGGKQMRDSKKTPGTKNRTGCIIAGFWQAATTAHGAAANRTPPQI